MSHLILLGDSIFDNAAYTEGGPDVVTQLNDLLPAGWAASLLAIDGSITDDIAGQVGGLPADASHLVLSVGGNDALQQAHRLLTPAASTEEALGLVADLADLAERFEHDYRAAIEACLRTAIAHRLPVIDLRAICTHPEDYVNVIEPSSAGGEKIARAITALTTGAIPNGGITHIIAG
jgi:hypothetical protein